MSKYELTAVSRQEFGKGASRRLRRLADQVPAIMYGGGEPAAALSVDHNKLLKALENESFYSHILTIHIDGKAQKAVLKDLQRHPFKPRILHLDLLRITGKEKIHMNIPLHFIGGDVAPGVVEQAGVVSHVLSNVEVRCLPDDLPEFIQVDLSQLKLDESIHLSQLPLTAGVELVALAHGEDATVATIHMPRIEVEEVATPEEELAAAGAEGEAPAADTTAESAADKGKDKE